MSAEATGGVRQGCLYPLLPLPPAFGVPGDELDYQDGVLYGDLSTGNLVGRAGEYLMNAALMEMHGRDRVQWLNRGLDAKDHHDFEVTTGTGVEFYRGKDPFSGHSERFI